MLNINVRFEIILKLDSFPYHFWSYVNLFMLNLILLIKVKDYNM